MDSSDEEDALLLCIFGAAQFVVLEEEAENRKRLRRNRSVWVRNWVTRRSEFGFYHQLLVELEMEEPHLCKKFLRMNINDFNHLLELVTPLISKEDTTMRKSISAGERLALTLRFLASGDSFTSLQYLFRIPQPTISSIIPEVCGALFEVLKNNYLKVNEKHRKQISLINLKFSLFSVHRQRTSG